MVGARWTRGRLDLSLLSFSVPFHMDRSTVSFWRSRDLRSRRSLTVCYAVSKRSPVQSPRPGARRAIGHQCPLPTRYLSLPYLQTADAEGLSRSLCQITDSMTRYAYTLGYLSELRASRSRRELTLGSLELPSV